MGIFVATLLVVSPVESLIPLEILLNQFVSPAKLQEKARSIFEIKEVVYVARTSDGIEIGITSKKAENTVKEKLKQLGIPMARVKIVYTEPIYELAKLEVTGTKITPIQEAYINSTPIKVNSSPLKPDSELIEKSSIIIKNPDYTIKINSTPVGDSDHLEVNLTPIKGSTIYVNITPKPIDGIYINITPIDTIIIKPTPKPIIELPPVNLTLKPRLDSKVRPFVGGLEIFSDKGAYCTLGFNAKLGNTLGFVTNSHCTLLDFSRDGSLIYQPFFPDAIGMEILDPAPSHLTVSQCNDGVCIAFTLLLPIQRCSLFESLLLR